MKKRMKYLVIHCTATPAGREVTLSDLKRWHLKERGWKRLGYTDLIHLDGTIERITPNNDDEWVDEWELTNGVAGKNAVSRHIVYAGGIDRQGRAKDTRTSAQVEALKRYVLDFHRRHPSVRIVGHNELAAKACPSFDVQAWLRSIGITQ